MHCACMINFNYCTIKLLNTFCIELLLLPPDGHVVGIPARQGEGPLEVVVDAFVAVPTGLVVDHEDPLIFSVLLGPQHIRSKVKNFLNLRMIWENRLNYFLSDI